MPAAHYCCGGIACDENGKTRLDRLYVAGESSFTGLHGANRLASNSLLEAVVYGTRAAEAAISTAAELPELHTPYAWDHLDSINSDEKVIISHLWQEVRMTMWNLVGIVRSNKRLELAQKRLSVLRQEVRDYYWRYRVTSNLVELRNVITVAELIVSSALQRHENRGLHYNTDFPEEPKDNDIQNTILIKPSCQ